MEDMLTKLGGVSGVLALASSILILISSLLAIRPLLRKFRFDVRTFIGFLPQRKHVWGTVYDSHTKRPIPFAKVQLLDRQKRLLETRIADSEGRYGFLTTLETSSSEKLEFFIVASADSYQFPSRREPTTDAFLYSNLYFGAPIVRGDLALVNFDIPLDPQQPASVGRRGSSVSLGLSIAALADIGFWVGLVVVPLNYFIAPNPFTMGILFMFFGTVSLRVWSVREHPFGMVIDSSTGAAMPFALIALNDTEGRRIGFTVSDEQGRYFLVAKQGQYQLNVSTSAMVQPPRQSSVRISVKNGWITQELKV
jgi:hypothetical protein